MTLSGRRRAWILATLVAGLVLPNLFSLLPESYLTFALYFACVTGFVLAIWRIDIVPLASVGLRRPGWVTVLSGLAVWAVGAAVLPFVSDFFLSVLGNEGLQAGLDKVSSMPGPMRLFVALGAGAVEELLYRGFAIERLTTLTGRPWAAGLVAAIIFGLAHVPAWGLGFALAADLPFGIYMTAFYLWRRDLVACMIAHSTGLAVAMLTTA